MTFAALPCVRMATQCSFDVTSNVDLQEVDNALNQARKEVAQRYDFKEIDVRRDVERTLRRHAHTW